MALAVGAICTNIGDQDWLAGSRPLRDRQRRRGTVQRAPRPLRGLGVCRREVTMKRSGSEGIAFAKPERAITCTAQPDGVCKHRLKYSAYLTHRAADDPKHFGGGRLLLPRFLKFARLALKLFLQIANGQIGLLRRVGTLRPRRLAVLRFRWFPAYCATPCHVGLPVAKQP